VSQGIIDRHGGRLTSRLVIIAGWISGIVPGIEHDATPNELHRQEQEQRRLFYVGMTRDYAAQLLGFRKIAVRLFESAGSTDQFRP
jgi:superfamily I DNA/RNA helicase